MEFIYLLSLIYSTFLNQIQTHTRKWHTVFWACWIHILTYIVVIWFVYRRQILGCLYNTTVNNAHSVNCLHGLLSSCLSVWLIKLSHSHYLKIFNNIQLDDRFLMNENCGRNYADTPNVLCMGKYSIQFSE